MGSLVCMWVQLDSNCEPCFSLPPPCKTLAVHNVISWLFCCPSDRARIFFGLPQDWCHLSMSLRKHAIEYLTSEWFWHSCGTFVHGTAHTIMQLASLRHPQFRKVCKGLLILKGILGAHCSGLCKPSQARTYLRPKPSNKAPAWSAGSH